MRRFGQITSLVIIGSSVATAVVIASIAVTNYTAVAEARRVANYAGDIYGQDRVFYRRSTPTWINRFLPVAHVPLVDRIVAINYISPLTTDDSVRIASRYKLRSLFLSGGQVTDIGVTYLRDQSTLEELSLRNTQITDDAIPVLANLSSLQVLSLYGTDISDGAVFELASLPNLRKLNLTDTFVSPEAVTKLRILLPSCCVGEF